MGGVKGQWVGLREEGRVRVGNREEERGGRIKGEEERGGGKERRKGEEGGGGGKGREGVGMDQLVVACQQIFNSC